MSNVKLKIEKHKNNNNTISFFLYKKKYVKDSNNLHKILKEKLKDRYRVKGAFFSVPRNKNKIKYKKKKDGSSCLLDIEEANYLISKNNYEKLKHDIYIKEKKDRENRKKENFDKDLLKKDINYTTLKETIYQFLRFKNKSNLYRANIKKNKLELKLANKISKKNFINQTLKTVKLHFGQVKGKIDLGRKPMEETENEYAYKKLAEKIENSRIKYMNRIKNENEQTTPNKDKSWFRKSFMIINKSEKIKKELNLLDILSNNLAEKNISINLKKEKMESRESVNSNDINDNNNKREKKDKKNFISYYKIESNENDNLSRNKTHFSGINKINNNIKRKKIKNKKYILKDKKIKIDVNNNNFNYFENDINPKLIFKYDSNGNENSNSNFRRYQDRTNISKTINILSNNQDSIDNTLFNKDIPNKMIETINNIKYKENINNNISNKTNSSSENNKHFIIDLKNIEKMKKNNLIVSMKKKNPTFWNNNMKRVQTAGFRAISNKVTNKPLYTTKIGDLVREFNRIKSLSKKSKIRMREKHLTTINEIDKIAGIKEDLLMFNLKIKYFNCAFPKKKEKIIYHFIIV